MRAPLEECEAAGALRDIGIPHHLIDAPAEQLSDADFLQRVKASDADLICIAVTFGSLEQDLFWVRKIRAEMPNALIGLRGAPCYVWAKQLLTENPAISFCLHGEYELTFKHLCSDGIETCPGLSYRAASGQILSNPAVYAQDLDLLPLPDRSSISQNLYKVRGFGAKQSTVRVQRGCPFPCSYCLVHTVSGKTARHRSAQHIVKEIKALLATGISHFYLRADTFTVNKRWAIALAEEIRKEAPRARWVTTTRVDCVDEEVIAAMSAGGCYGISFGIDVASEKIGALVRKPPQIEKATRAMRLCDQYNILSLGYFMIGFIWDTAETLQETRHFISKVRPDLLTIHFAHPYPGTAYFAAVQAAGLKTTSLKAQAEPALDVPALTGKELRTAARGMLINHYSRPSVIWSVARKSLRKSFAI